MDNATANRINAVFIALSATFANFPIWTKLLFLVLALASMCIAEYSDKVTAEYEEWQRQNHLMRQKEWVETTRRQVNNRHRT